MDHVSDGSVCPYCRLPLLWIPQRWFGRGAYVCSRCGEFPDLTRATRATADTASQSRGEIRRLSQDRPRVMLVDDSAEFRDLYALMLEQTATVITVSHGEEALEVAVSEPLDAIVLDVMMPGMDGWRTCERLKTNPLTSGIPVIMLTSWDGPDVPARAERAGAAAVLIKPCRLERLIAAVETAVHRRFGGPRRWTRKPVGADLPVTVNTLPGRMVNVSYGGLCVAVDRLPPALPASSSSVDIVVHSGRLSLKAEAVWATHGLDESWLCGAEIARASDEWRGIVDAL